MAEQDKAQTGKTAPPTPVPPSRDQGMTSADGIALLLTVLWILFVGYYFFRFGFDTAQADTGVMVVTLVAMILPVALIWMASALANMSKRTRRDASRLQTSVEGMRQAYLTETRFAEPEATPDLEKRLEEMAARQKETETAIASFASARDAETSTNQGSQTEHADGVVGEESQPALALGSPAIQSAPLQVSDFIGAMNFPEDENDHEGFRQLRRALNDPISSKLIHASQDVLTLLSQDGIYMDDLHPERSKPEVWRKFADGERGRTVSGLGGVRDRTSLSLASGRMRTDPVFRDTVHHFVREFDKTFESFAHRASDAEIAQLTDTRTARAFMLLGRVTGIFD